MSILNDTVNQATAAANQVQAIIIRQFQQLAISGKQGYNLIWKNPAASPADILAALGSNAYAVFQLANLNINTVASAATLGGTTAPTIPSIPSNYILTFNDDGSANLQQVSSSSSGN